MLKLEKKINYNKARCDFNLKLRYKNIFNIFGVKNIIELENSIIEMKKKAKLESNFWKLKIDLKSNVVKLIDGINVPG